MKILVLGAGRMGHGAVFDLIHNSPEVEAVTVADYDLIKVTELAGQIKSPRLTAIRADASDKNEITGLMKRHDAVISCINYWHNLELSKIAVEAKNQFLRFRRK